MAGVRKAADEDGRPHTAHTSNPVPLIVTDPEARLRDGGDLSDIVPTVLELMRLPQPSAMTGRSLLWARRGTAAGEE